FFGGDPFGARRPITVQSEPLHLEVLPLPDAGKPADFSGAVGTFDLHVSASPRELKAGDPVTITTTVEGDGNLAAITPPLLPAARSTAPSARPRPPPRTPGPPRSPPGSSRCRGGPATPPPRAAARTSRTSRS